MHESAYRIGKNFFDAYCSRLGDISVAEIGSQNINGSLRDHITSNIIEYIGVDFVPGNGVDIVLEKSYEYPFESDKFDIVVTSSCFEHSELFWLSFQECLRILKPTGILYCSAPNYWPYHAYPVDCWRFNGDAGQALETWGKYNKIPVKMLETFLYRAGLQRGTNGEYLYDWVAVFLKDEKYLNLHPARILNSLHDDGSVLQGKIIL